MEDGHVSPSDSVELEMGEQVEVEGEHNSPHMMNGHLDGEQYSDGDPDSLPVLEIVEQPQARGFRFRYECEGPSHGGLQGEKSERYRKTFPSIRIKYYNGQAKIVVTLVTDEAIPKSHAHKLVGRDCNNGICVKEVKTGNVPITFPNLCVQHITRRKAADVLHQRICESMQLERQVKMGNLNADIALSKSEIENAKSSAEKQAKDMQLNVVRLCFQAYLRDDNGSFTRLLPSVVSTPIYDSKAPGANALKICRMDKYGGCCTGNEEVFLLCEKVQKDDIQVRFVEQDETGKVIWEDHGIFGPYDVHRQFAIVFKTPRYWNTNIEKPVNVLIMLQRKSDTEVSDPKSFTYYPQANDFEGLNRKRRKVIPNYLSGNYRDMDPKGGASFGGGGNGGGDSGDSRGSQNGVPGKLPHFQELKPSPEVLMQSGRPVIQPRKIYRTPANDIAQQQPLINYGRGIHQLNRDPSHQQISPPYMGGNSQYRNAPQHPNMTPPYIMNQGSPNSDYAVSSPPTPQCTQNSRSPPTIKTSPSPVQTEVLNNPGFLDPMSLSNIQGSRSNEMGLMPVTESGFQPTENDLTTDGFPRVSMAGIDDITPTLITSSTHQMPNSMGLNTGTHFTNSNTGVSYGSQQMITGGSDFGVGSGNQYDSVVNPVGLDNQQVINQESLDLILGILNQSNTSIPIQTGMGGEQETPYMASMNNSGFPLTSRSSTGGMYQHRREIDMGYDFVDGFDEPDARLVGTLSAADAALPEEPSILGSESGVQAGVETDFETKTVETPVNETTSKDSETMVTTKEVGIQVEMPFKTETQASALSDTDAIMRTAMKTSQALQVYAASGDIRCLLMVQRYLMSVQDQNGDLPLHTSLINLKYEVFQNILDVMLTLPDAQSRVNAYNHHLQTPLHLAVLTKQHLAVDLLVRAGADPSLQDRNGNTPAHLAILYGHDVCLSYLLKYIRAGVSKQQPFPELNIRNYDGFSPAHLAAQTENLEAMKMLVRAQVDVNMADGKSGRSPLHHAVEADELSIAAFLILQAGAQVNVKRFDGNTPLHIACGRSNVGMVALLMAGGADPNTENDDVESSSTEDEDWDEVDMGSAGECESSEAEQSPPLTPEKGENEDDNGDIPRPYRGMTPADFVDDNEKILKILRGEPYTSIMDIEKQMEPKTEEDFTSMMSSLRLNSSKVESGLGSMFAGDLDKIDYPTRLGLSKLLDQPHPGSDWLALADRLGLRKVMQDHVEGHSPTRLLLTYFEECGGTVSRLTQALLDIHREDAFNLLNNAQYISQSENKSYHGDPMYDSGLSDTNQKHLTA